MITILSCIVVTYLSLALFRIRQKMSPSKLDAALKCPHTWDTLFVLTALLMFFTHSLGLWIVLGIVMVLFWLAAWFARQADAQQRSYNDHPSRPLALLNSVYPLLAIALLVGWHVWSSYDPARHPVAQRAKHRQQELYDSRKLMERQLVTMYRYLDEFEVPVTDNTYSMNQIQCMAEELIELADNLTDEYNSLINHHAEYIEQVTDAPEMFRHAGQIWRQYAMQEQAVGNTEIAQEYAGTAEAWDAYARKADSLREDSYTLKELGEVIFYVGRARLYLTRLAVNSPLAMGAAFLDEKRHFESNVRQFIEKFDDLRTTIRGLTNQLNEEGGAPGPIEERVYPLVESQLRLEELRSTTPQGIPRMISEISASAD